MSSTPAPVTLKPDVRLPLLVAALSLALLPLPARCNTTCYLPCAECTATT